MSWILNNNHPRLHKNCNNIVVHINHRSKGVSCMNSEGAI